MDESKSAERRATDTARDAAGRLQESASKATEGFREYQRKVLAAAQANLNAIFEYAHDLIEAQSMSELIEVSANHSRRQLETMAEQTRELANAAQKLAADSARPLGGLGSQFSQMS